MIFILNYRKATGKKCLIKFSKEHLKHREETQVERQQRLNGKSKMIMYPKSTFMFGVPSDR